MDKCLEKDKKKVNVIPLKFGEELRMVCLLEGLVSTNETYNLLEYVEELMSGLNDRRRKKYIRVINKKFVKMICKRWRFPNFILEGKEYKFKSYWPVVEVIQWQKDKTLCHVNYNSITGDEYRRDDMIHYLISLNSSGSNKTLLTDVDDVEKEVTLLKSRSLIWNSSHISLQETKSDVLNTQIYLHVLYEII